MAYSPGVSRLQQKSIVKPASSDNPQCRSGTAIRTSDGYNDLENRVSVVGWEVMKAEEDAVGERRQTTRLLRSSRGALGRHSHPHPCLCWRDHCSARSGQPLLSVSHVHPLRLSGTSLRPRTHALKDSSRPDRAAGGPLPFLLANHAGRPPGTLGPGR